MDLRAPIPPDHIYTITKNNTPTNYDNDSNEIIIPILCRMYVASKTMQLGTEARFASFVIFHRYVAHFLHFNNSNESKGLKASNNNETRRKEQRKHLGIVAAACLFLGCKSQEESRRIRDVINLSCMLNFEDNDDDGGETITIMDDSTSKYSTNRKPFSDASGSTISLLESKIGGGIVICEASQPPDLDESYWKTKERIISTEQSILRLIKFDVSVSQPHRALIVVYEEILIFHDLQDKEKNVLKYAWRRLNDSLFYVPALMCSCTALACGAIDLALDEKASKSTMNDMKKWKECVGVGKSDMISAKEKLIGASNFLRILRNQPHSSCI